MKRAPQITPELLYAGAWALKDLAKSHYQTWQRTSAEHRPFWRELARKAIAEHRALYLVALSSLGKGCTFATWVAHRQDVIRRRQARATMKEAA